MFVLRLASLVVLAIWVGGLAALGFVAAPVIFSTLEAQDPAGGRALAGLVFGAVFRRFQHVAWVLGGAAHRRARCARAARAAAAALGLAHVDGRVHARAQRS